MYLIIFLKIILNMKMTILMSNHNVNLYVTETDNLSDNQTRNENQNLTVNLYEKQTYYDNDNLSGNEK